MRTQKKPPKPDERDRSVAIYAKAAEVIHAKGFAATSMSDIAEAVDLTKAGLYYYIESKEDLLFGIMSYAMDRLESKVIEPARAEPDPETRLRTLISRHARLLTEGNTSITILTDEVAGLTPKHRRLIVGRKRAYFDLVRDTLDEVKRAGKLRDADTTVAAFGLFGMLLWLPRWYQPKGRLTKDQVIEEVTTNALKGLLNTSL